MIRKFGRRVAAAKNWLSNRAPALLTALWFCSQTAGVEPPPLLDGVAFSREVHAADGGLLRLTTAGDGRYRMYRSRSELSDTVIRAALLQEDRAFGWHFGVNPVAVARAAYNTLTGSRRYGASTITMQLARLRLGLETNHLSGKLKQMLYALWYEIAYSKGQILEAYFNLVPYGGNIEGLGAASLIYFEKAPKDLGVSEAILLTLIPQDPSSRRPKNGARLLEDNQEVREAKARLSHAWRERYGLSPTDEVALQMETSYRPRVRLPFEAPHYVQELLDSEPLRPRLDGTLIPQFQTVLETQVQGWMKEKARVGIQNAAVLLVDTVTMNVVAHVGSADFTNTALHGQVDGTKALRSPGSTLKPFIYALAADQGLIHPATILKDTPMSWGGGYSPENNDGDFQGPISARVALNQSRNVPAVFLANQLKPSLWQFLHGAGVRFPREESYYGLALALGGAEVSLRDLVRLYAALANGGRMRELKWIQDPRASRQEAGRPVLSADAAAMVLDMMAHNPRPEEHRAARARSWEASVHWKTGTSWSFKDAWSMGIFDHYVLGVWVGNFDGASNPAFLGREAAAPLFFRIVDGIRARPDLAGPALTWVPPPSLKKVRVCPLSGKLAGPHCQATVETLFIPGKSPIHTCDVHREILVQSLTGLRTCKEGPGVRHEVHEFWSTDLLKLFREARLPRKLPPPWDPACAGGALRTARGAAPQILSPGKDIAVVVRAEGRGEGDALPLAASGDADARKFFWFLNGEYLGEAAPNTPLLWKPKPGRFALRVVDDQGRVATRALKVIVDR